MRQVGIRELKKNTSQILYEVQRGQVVEVTNRGTVVARLVPVQKQPLTDEELQALLDDLDTLAAEISARWPEGVSAQEALEDARG